VYRLLKRISTYPPGAKRDIVSLTKFSLRMLARRAIELEQEITVIDASLKSLVKEIALSSITRSATRWIANSSAQNPLSRHSDQEGSSCLTICTLIRGSTRSTGEDRANTRSTPGTPSTEGGGGHRALSMPHVDG
jgi:hypothetical protein